jgi:CHAD domain-containing protein
MSLSPSKSAAKQIRKQLKKRIDSALATLEPKRLSHERVHDARKSLKKARASLRLLRPALRNSDYREENTTLRDAARPLSAARDANVLPNTLRGLARHYRKPVSALKVSLKPEALHMRRTQLAYSRWQLRKARTRLKEMAVKGDNWSIVGPALKDIYRRGRRALAGARDEHSPEAFHEWRKQAKYLRYALETLEPVWPPVIRTLADDARTLTDYLGDDHDLTVLRQRIGAEELLRVPIGKRQTELRDKAVALGAKLYEEKPKDFIHRFAEYWHEWRA